ncbi:MAG: hypothetical protein Q8R10_18495 [Pseudomonas sp.]|uniref:hypothetical protein n=1 Tax=Pseudomonas sp. TaxID=306 RepID=UPI0027368349|nr:hypothetical protein [Pseudomonas sp.]MDP3848411.1 hypothetical protein [Pseudomonas sp.]
MHSEEEKLAKLADRVFEGLSSQTLDEQPASKAGIKIKANSGNINFGTQFTIGERVEERALLPAQRKELHQLRAQCEELGDDPRDVWREVHTQLSVTSLDEVTATQFVQAKGVIQARLERLQEEADRSRLVSKILRAADEKDARHALSNFCELNFGRTQLNLLKRAELPRALEFILQFEVRPSAPAVSAAVPKMELREFLITYHWNCAGLFLFGLLVGGLWI